MAVIGLIVHPDRDRAVTLAAETATWLTAEGHDVRIGAEDVSQCPPLEPWRYPLDTIAAGLDLAVSIGGDGTMLRAVDLVVDHDVPVLGINLGRLGYLTEVEPPWSRSALSRFLAGDYRVEDRMTLAITVERAEAAAAHKIALNDAVVEKLEAGHTVHVGVAVDGRPFVSYAADGLIVATPTGSTAYNLSAGGPIVSPALDAMVVTAVAPHSLFDRSMVIEPNVTVRLHVLSGEAALAVDGQRFGHLAAGDGITCRRGAHAAHLVGFGDRDYRRILKAKFGLTDR